MIQIENLVKKFPHKTKTGKNSEKTAVDNLSLSVKAGEIFGLLALVSPRSSRDQQTFPL